MNHYIQSTYVHARELYGTNINGKPEGFNTIQVGTVLSQHLANGLA